MTIRFACPHCRGGLKDLSCVECGRPYEVVDGIPILTVGASDASAQQAAFFDGAVDSEFEIERPVGAPALYGWLLGEKFRRGVAGVAVRGRTALVVCGGSGMDAEFLAKDGAEVVSLDISPGAARRTAERARRHGVLVTPIVADAEHLPFADRSVDIAYVHDGLHHLEQPLAGLREMARVARYAVCVSEPADAFLTGVGIRLGVAATQEEAGNRVARLRLGDVRAVLEDDGYRIGRAKRYAMFYRHEPGVAMHAFSREPLFSVARGSLALANTVIGSFGNKLVIQGFRR